MAKFECGLCGRISESSACRCYKGKQMIENQIASHHAEAEIAFSDKEMITDLIDAAWSLCRNVHVVKETSTVPGSLRERVGELRRVLERIEDTRNVECELCNGMGGIAVAGSDKSRPGMVCPACSGEGITYGRR